jgi:hypothetical protein
MASMWRILRHGAPGGAVWNGEESRQEARFQLLAQGLSARGSRIAKTLPSVPLKVTRWPMPGISVLGRTIVPPAAVIWHTRRQTAHRSSA